MTVQYFATRHTPDQYYLSSAVEQAGADIAIFLDNFLPHDRHRRYEYIEHVKNGMMMPNVHILTLREHRQPSLGLAYLLYRTV